MVDMEKFGEPDKRKSIPELVREIAQDEITVADVQCVETDMGEIVIVECWAMESSEVLRFFIHLPGSIIDRFNFGDELPMVNLRKHLDSLSKKGE